MQANVIGHPAWGDQSLPLRMELLSKMSPGLEALFEQASAKAAQIDL